MFHSRTLGCLTLTAAFVWLAGGTGQTQATPRQGGPLDWSHGRIVESRRGPNAARTLSRTWRTYRKQLRRDAARAQSDRLAAADPDVPPAAPTGFRVVIPGRTEPVPVAGTPELDWNLRTGGYGSVIGYPAKYNFDIATSRCDDVMYFTVNQSGASTTVNVIAITNPYAGCTGNSTGKTPTVKFGLRLGTGTATSPVPSMDGKILYVFQSRTTGNGGVILHAINVDNILSSVGTYNFTTTNWSNAHTLAAPTTSSTSEQKFQMTFSNVANDISSPFLDYGNDQLFFGDSVGRIHRVANVSSSSATRDTTNYPVSCGSKALQSPVYVNGQIIVSSLDGRLYRIDTTKPAPYTCVASVQVGDGTTTGGALSAPMIDVTNGKIIVGTNYDDFYSLRGVVAFNLMFTAGEAPTSQAMTGPGKSAIAPTSPTFDEDFWSDNDGSLYAPGGPQSGEGTYLVRIPYAAGQLGTAAGYATLTRSGSSASVATSPVTEFLTASTQTNADFLYIGGSSGTYTYLNRISSKFNGTVTSPVAMAGSFSVTGGVSSGISIDTRTTAVTGTTATANIYFGTIGIASTTQSTIVQLAQQF